ncbi:MAG: MraY family glycosyltransferase [Parcubacteria group bacterium]
MNTWLLLIVFLTSLICTPLAIKFARKSNIMDKADNDPLKIHKVSTPRFGGAAIILAIIIGIIVYNFILPEIRFQISQVAGIIIGGAIIFFTGLYDDVKKLKPLTRLILHLLSGLIIVLAGINFLLIPVALIGAVIAILIIAYSVNALNMIDGMDGLCAGLSIVSSVGFLLIGIQNANILLTVVAGFLLASLLGFLPYNFHVAKIFLGDAGSGLIGFLTGLMIIISIRPNSLFDLLAVILIAGIPIIDMTVVMIRRKLNRKPLMAGDRTHIYDQLLLKGLSQRKIWFILIIIQIVLTFGGVMIYKI